MGHQQRRSWEESLHLWVYISKGQKGLKSMT
jgi:hypothetical protein